MPLRAGVKLVPDQTGGLRQANRDAMPAGQHRGGFGRFPQVVVIGHRLRRRPPAKRHLRLRGLKDVVAPVYANQCPHCLPGAG